MWGILGKGHMAKTEDTDFTQVRIRMGKKLHADLEKASDERGTSMNAEIVDRLERSFQIDRLIGGPIIEDRALLAVIKIIASAMFDCGRSAAFAATLSPKETERWADNAFAYDQAVNAANTVLEAFRPAGSKKAPNHFDQKGGPLSGYYEMMGAGFANGILENVARGAARAGGDINKVALISEELGPLRDRIRHLAVGPETTAAEVWGGKKPKKTKNQ
jgi:hypothetical protein